MTISEPERQPRCRAAHVRLAYALEAVLVAKGIGGSLPYLNPGHAEEA